MNPISHFYFSGFAHLEHFFFKNDKFIARIKVIDCQIEDEIFLECEVDGIVQEQIFNLWMKAKNGYDVIVAFKAKYHQFNAAFSRCFCEGKNRDSHIIHLSCKLTELGNCYVDDNLVDKNSLQFLKVA